MLDQIEPSVPGYFLDQAQAVRLLRQVRKRPTIFGWNAFGEEDGAGDGERRVRSLACLFDDLFIVRVVAGFACAIENGDFYALLDLALRTGERLSSAAASLAKPIR